MASGFIQRFKGKIAASLITIANGGQILQSVQNSITAHSGGGQGSAVQLTGMACFITTVAASGDSVILPASVPGMEISVINTTPTNPAAVFPASGEKINNGSANASVNVAAASITMFYCGVAGMWWTK